MSRWLFFGFANEKIMFNKKAADKAAIRFDLYAFVVVHSLRNRQEPTKC